MKHLIAKSENFPESESDSLNYNMAFYCLHCGAELTCVFNYLSRYSYCSSDLENKLKYESNPEKIKKLKKKIADTKARENAATASMQHAYNAYAEAENLTTCPICGGRLCKEAGYFMPRYNRNHIDKCKMLFRLKDEDERYLLRNYPQSAEGKLEHMKLLREEIEPIKAQKRAENFVSNNDLPVAIKFDSAKRVQDSPERLKEYILTLLHLENNIYSLSRLLSELYYLELKCNRNVVLETNEPIYMLKAKLNELKKSYETALSEAEKADTYNPKVSVKYPVEPTAPVLAKPGLFNKKKVLAENEMLTCKYQADMEAYRQEVQLCDEKKARMIEKKRADFIKTAKEKAALQMAAMDKAAACLEIAKKEMSDKIVPSQAAKELIDADIAETEALLIKTLSTRNELYGYNIIFEKYRNAVALSSFYEYLMSGRCSSLAGADGAYNIYENEIRLNQVISQLDVVISSLEDIKQNQYMIYAELQTIHRSLDNLNSTMNKALASVQSIEATTTKLNEHMEHISRNADVIAHNTAVTAYYSKVNADLTKALGYMVAIG